MLGRSAMTVPPLQRPSAPGQQSGRLQIFVSHRPDLQVSVVLGSVHPLEALVGEMECAWYSTITL